MKKRIISTLVVLALLFSMLIGCMFSGGDDDANLNIIDDNYRNYYEIFVGSFYDSDGDGMGDLNGVTEKLDYITDLGCNGIWLMPIMPSPTYHKYDVEDYENVDSAYGTAEDFKKLVDACHEKGIRLVIDLVMNHSSSKHPWFTQACEYLAGLKDGEQPDLSVCPYAGYYNFSNEKVSQTYYQVPGTTNWWYEGSFWSEMPDLNMENDAVRKEFENIADYWMDLGVDGFRMDAAMHYTENATVANSDVLNWYYTYCKKGTRSFIWYPKYGQVKMLSQIIMEAKHQVCSISMRGQQRENLFPRRERETRIFWSMQC